MKRPPHVLILAVLLAAGGLVYWMNRPGGIPQPPSVASGGVTKRHDPQMPAADPLPAALQRMSDGLESEATLRDLKAILAGMPPDRAVALIRAFLASGRDQQTGLGFAIAADGSLEQWPTMRTFLLDALAGIDPAAAAAIGREILASPTSADEWALALRNIARVEGTEGSRDYLRGKTEELIRNPAWQQSPSVGYLNAFDVLVHIGATESTPLLSELLQNKDRKDLAHAAFLTLDRLVQRQPVDLLDRLTADSALRQSRPEMVSQQFARADLRDVAQREIVRAWLLDPSRTAAELRSFAGVYPNNSHFVSHNLLTDETGMSGEEIAAHDREALRNISTWAADPAFSGVKSYLDLMISRLEGFTGKSPSRPAVVDKAVPANNN